MRRPTSGPPWLGRALLIARVNARRQLRSAREHPWIGVFQLFALLFGVVVAVGRLPVAGYEAVWSTPGGYVFGTRLATDAPAVLETVRGFSGVVFVLLVFLTVLKDASEGMIDSHVESLLVAAGSRSVAVGGVCWSLLVGGWQFGTLVVAGAVAFGSGAGSPAAVVGLAIAGLAALVTAVPLGYLLALAVRLVFRRVALVRRHRVVVAAPLAVAYFAVFVRIRTAMTLLAELPVGWYADAGLLAVTGAADPVRGATVLALAPAAAVGLTALSVPVGERVWYDDPPADDPDSTVDSGGDARDPATPTGGSGRTGVVDRETALSGPTAALCRSGLVSRPTAAVARTVWLRIGREPRALLFAALPVVVAASGGAEVVGRRPAALPAVVAVYGGATVGMGATLNPLGSAGSGLSTVLTAPDGARHLLRGYALSAALPGVPVVAALSALSAVAVGFGPTGVVVAAVLGAVLAAAAAVVSLGVGAVVPNIEGLRPTGSGVRPPRLWATTSFLFAMAVLGLPALVGVGWAGRLAGGVGQTTAAVAGVSLSALAAGVASLGAYRLALGAVVGHGGD